MATEPIEQVNNAPKERLRPPVEGGTGHIESLGRWIDDLMGHSKIEREVKEEVTRFMEAVNSQPDDEPQEPPAPDPPKIDPPKPVPGGTGTEEKGGKPGGTRPERPDETQTR